MSKLLIVTNTMGRAGAEKSLIALLRALDYERTEVHLLSIINRGELFEDVPKQVRILNRKPHAVPVLGWRGTLGIARTVAGRMLRGGIRYLPRMVKRGIKEVRRGRPLQPDKLLWPMLAATTPAPDTQYDMVLAFIEGASTYYVAERVKARSKIAFVHVNYEKAGYDRDFDKPFYGKMDYICCVSDGVRSALTEVYPEFADRIRLFPNIVNPTLIREGATLPGGFSDSFSGLRLLTVARLHPQKGLDMAIEALAKLHSMGRTDISWYVVGEGMEKPRLKKLIRERGLEGRFVLLGARENPYPYMRQCDVYVQPSVFEGLSLTLLEALLLGKPCITTDFDGVPDLLVDGHDALVVPFSADRMADAIARLADDRKLRARLAEGARNIQIPFLNETRVLYQIMDGRRWEDGTTCR